MLAITAACSGGGSGNAPECTTAADCAAPGACEDVACVAGACSLSASEVGTSCGIGLRCDVAGACVECLSASDCPGSDSACRTRACEGGMCHLDIVLPGTPLATQTPGDCRQDRCDAEGNVISAVDDSDVPDDQNPCTANACTDGIPSSDPVTPGTPCAAGFCDASGQCVGCLAPANCPGTDTDCRTRACGEGTCGWSYAPPGTYLSAQTAGDCHRSECDGSGNAVDVVDDADVPVDATTCTDDVCTAGVPSNPDASAGDACSEGVGHVCDGNGQCVECVSGGDCASGVCDGNVCQDPPPCHPVVNEVQVKGEFYFSDEFAEIYNGCSGAVDLSGWRLSSFPFGTGNTEYVSFTFAAGATIAAGGYVVLGGDQYPGPVFATIDGWGGFRESLGAVALLDAQGAFIDSVAYGGASGSEGESATVPPADQSIGRKPNGVDTDDNSADFSLYATPSPGAANP